MNRSRLRCSTRWTTSWALSVEFTDDPHPRNFLWEMWGLPMFDLRDPAAILLEVTRCREAYPTRYIRVNAYDRRLGRQTTALSFIVQRPQHETGFRVERQEGPIARSATHCTPMPPTVAPGSDTNAER